MSTAFWLFRGNLTAFFGFKGEKEKGGMGVEECMGFIMANNCTISGKCYKLEEER